MPDQHSQLETMITHTHSDPTLEVHERERRVSILRSILLRIQQEGDHTSKPHSDRARQFMPFAALKGYHELAYERECVPESKHVMTDERAAELSQIISCLSKGATISIVHYENKHYTTTCGVVTEINEAFRTIRIVKKNIDFDNIFSIEILNRSTV